MFTLGQLLISHSPHSVLEHSSAKHRQMALDHLVAGLLEFATNEQGSKSVTKALKEGGKETRQVCETHGGINERVRVYLPLPTSVRGMRLDIGFTEAAGP